LRDVVAWQKANESVLGVYALTEVLPKGETFGLTAQSRRAAVSVPANIAEGFKERGIWDTLRFLNIAQGSPEECRYYPILCADLRYADPAQLMARLDEVSRLLARYLVAIRTDAPAS
jgi:four helix bundle protein